MDNNIINNNESMDEKVQNTSEEVKAVETPAAANEAVSETGSAADNTANETAGTQTASETNPGASANSSKACKKAGRFTCFSGAQRSTSSATASRRAVVPLARTAASARFCRETASWRRPETTGSVARAMRGSASHRKVHIRIWTSADARDRWTGMRTLCSCLAAPMTLRRDTARKPRRSRLSQNRALRP